MDRSQQQAFEAVVRTLGSARRVLCVMHARPDGDACGSTLGLALALMEQGREVTLFCATEVPYNLRFLPGLEKLVHEVPSQERFDATTICDVGAAHRVGPGLPDRERLGVLLNIDHHLTSDGFGDVNYVDPDAASVGVMIHRILRGLKHPLSLEVATALYVSVLTDTGSFRYSSTDPEALRCAADLVEAGVQPWDVASEIYEQQPLERILLLREVLGTLEISPDGTFASIVVAHEAAARAAGGRDDLTDGFINFARGIRGVEVAAQLTEPAPGSTDPWYLSLRSRGRVNVAAVAARFGGGGHHNAAGGTLRGALEEVRRQVADAVRAEILHASAA